MRALFLVFVTAFMVGLAMPSFSTKLYADDDCVNCKARWNGVTFQPGCSNGCGYLTAAQKWIWFDGVCSCGAGDPVCTWVPTLPCAATFNVTVTIDPGSACSSKVGGNCKGVGANTTQISFEGACGTASHTERVEIWDAAGCTGNMCWVDFNFECPSCTGDC